MERVVDAAAAGDVARAVSGCQRLMAAGDGAQSVIAAVQWHFARLHRIRAGIDAGRSLDEAFRQIRPPLFSKRRTVVEAQCRRWTGSKLAAALGTAGIAGLGGAQVTGLSGGELQRAALARALLRKPDLLVLDEPTQGLDQPGEAAFYRLIERLRRETGVGICMVSHDLHVVMSASDRVICLNGHVCCEGAPVQVSAMPEYRALFGLGTQGALALYRHEHDHAHGREAHDHGYGQDGEASP
jgi:ATPase subunit of ABC transporter with duplicated ATPase domains